MLTQYDTRNIWADVFLFFFLFFFFYSVLRPFQDYFSSYDMGQLVGGAKTGEP